MLTLVDFISSDTLKLDPMDHLIQLFKDILSLDFLFLIIEKLYVCIWNIHKMSKYI